MRRYQMYLEPTNIDAIDRIAQLSAVPRSQIIRDLVSVITQRYGKLIPDERKVKTSPSHPFDKYIGKFKLDDKRAYQKIDEIYLKN